MLRGATQMFLQATEGLYQRTLDKVARAKLGLSRTELEQSDLPYLVRAPEYDHIFASDNLLPTFERTLRGMGVSLAEQSNVHVDAEVRELKTPRAFCAPVRIPEEIYLVVMPKGGQDDYQALLHEGGHTEHFAHTDPALPFEFRFLGDNAVTEGFAFVFDHLTLNPRWLETYLDFAESQDYLTFANLVELYFLRRYAGKLAYETEFHKQTGPLDAMAGRYGALLSEAVQFEVPQANYLVDIDDGFYASNYLRAWMLEGALRMLLQDNYGMEWFSRPRGRGLAQGPVVDRPALLGRPAPAQERRRPARHAPARAPPRARAGPLARARAGPLARARAGPLARAAPSCGAPACLGARSAQRLHHKAAPAGAVELGEVDALPGAERQAAGLDRHGHAAAHHRRLHVGVRVALEVGERQVLRAPGAQGPSPGRARTLGSAFSLIVMPAVVCGQNTTTAPSRRPLPASGLLHERGHVDQGHAVAGLERECDHVRVLSSVSV